MIRNITQKLYSGKSTARTVGKVFLSMVPWPVTTIKYYCFKHFDSFTKNKFLFLVKRLYKKTIIQVYIKICITLWYNYTISCGDQNSDNPNLKLPLQAGVRHKIKECTRMDVGSVWLNQG